MNIQNWIINWFEEHTIASKDELTNGLEVDYFERGWIDSMGFIEFLSDVEEQFNIELDNEAFQNSDFSTIAGLARILNEME